MTSERSELLKTRMNRGFLYSFLALALSAALAAGCGTAPGFAGDGAGAETGEGKRFAIVTKSAGNPYGERESAGFAEVIEALGGTVVMEDPETASADAQISVIRSLMSRGIDAIAVAANDENALSDVLLDAAAAGIKVVTLDSDVDPRYRLTFCNQTDAQEVAVTLMDAIWDMTGGEGEYAILSATPQATNQNAWIHAMKELAETDEKYSGLILDEVCYGNDEEARSTEKTKELLDKYPNIKVICVPTVMGITSAAAVLKSEGSEVKLTGLGLPSEMKDYIGNGKDDPCPYMFLWNPVDLGRLAAYASWALVEGSITGAVGDTFEAGDIENSPYTLTEVPGSDGASEIILGTPLEFNPDNIVEWAELF